MKRKAKNKHITIGELVCTVSEPPAYSWESKCPSNSCVITLIS